MVTKAEEVPVGYVHRFELVLVPTNSEKVFSMDEHGQLSLGAQALLLPRVIPPMLRILQGVGVGGLGPRGGGGGVGTRPWWLALLACGGAYWPLALEPSAMTSRHPYYRGHPHFRGHPPAPGVGIQNSTSTHGVLP